MYISHGANLVLSANVVQFCRVIVTAVAFRSADGARTGSPSAGKMESFRD